MLKTIFKSLLIMAAVLIIVQLKISFLYENKAKQLGKFDNQIKELNIQTLELEERIAVYRSNMFVVENFLNGYVAEPQKIIYLNPYKSDGIITQR